MNIRRTVTFIFFSILLLHIFNGAGFGSDICGYDEMGMVEIIREAVVIKRIPVTVAATPLSWQQGLMNCPVLGKGTGMFFIYPDAKRRTFWMKNTYIELAIIFISVDGKIAAIKHGEPGSLDHIKSPGNIQSVLEINYLESRDFKVGDHTNLQLKSK